MDTDDLKCSKFPFVLSISYRVHRLTSNTSSTFHNLPQQQFLVFIVKEVLGNSCISVNIYCIMTSRTKLECTLQIPPSTILIGPRPNLATLLNLCILTLTQDLPVLSRVCVRLIGVEMGRLLKMKKKMLDLRQADTNKVPFGQRTPVL